MKIRFFTSLCLMMVAVHTAGWSQPAAEFDTTKFDFGVAYPQNKLVHDFIFKNAGNEELKIEQVRTSCGCTAAVLSKESIPAGATGAISVTMSTSVPGKMHKTATVVTNDPRNREIVLDILANVRDIWQWSPKTSFQFREVPFNSSAQQELTLTNIESEAFAIEGYKVSRPEFSVEHEKVDKDKVKFIVTFNSGTIKETITDSLEIRTDNPHQPVIRATLYGQVVGNIKYDRQRLYFGSVRAGETVTRELTATNTDPNASDFQITEITCDNENVSGVVMGSTDDGGIKMKFTYNAPKKPGYYNGEIHIKTNVPSERLSVLPFSVLVRK